MNQSVQRMMFNSLLVLFLIYALCYLCWSIRSESFEIKSVSQLYYNIALCRQLQKWFLPFVQYSILFFFSVVYARISQKWLMLQSGF